MVFELVEPTDRLARIRVAGVGGAGGNAVNRMIEAGLDGVDFFAINTDLQALRQSRAGQVIQIGHQVTRGLGSGGDPRVGRESVLEDEDTLQELLADSDMVFVTAGLGGGTGTGAAPVVARIAREIGALTVGVVTKPFRFEGKVRQKQAELGLEELRQAVDTLIVIPNERLLEVVPRNASMSDAFVFADNVLYEATRGIHDIIMKPHVVNLDFADVRSVMRDKGVALMGTGKAEGDDRAEDAAREAISSPLLENVDIRGAEGVLVNISGAEIGLMETNAVMSIIQEAAGDQAHIIFGYGIEPELEDSLQVTVIATGFDRDGAAAPAPASVDVSAEPELPPAAISATVEPEPAEEVATGEEAPPAAATAERPQLRVMAAAAGGDRPVVAPATAATDTAARFTMLETDPDPALRPAPETAPPAVDVTEDQSVSTAPEGDPHADAPHPAEGNGMSWRPDPNRRSPFASDGLTRDLSEPAYTRKYMD